MLSVSHISQHVRFYHPGAALIFFANLSRHAQWPAGAIVIAGNKQHACLVGQRRGRFDGRRVVSSCHKHQHCDTSSEKQPFDGNACQFCQLQKHFLLLEWQEGKWKFERETTESWERVAICRVRTAPQVAQPLTSPWDDAGARVPTARSRAAPGVRLYIRWAPDVTEHTAPDRRRVRFSLSQSAQCFTSSRRTLLSLCLCSSTFWIIMSTMDVDHIQPISRTYQYRKVNFCSLVIIFSTKILKKKKKFKSLSKD